MTIPDLGDIARHFNHRANARTNGGTAAMPGVPFVIEVLEFGQCDDDGCDAQTFRFKDPGGLGDDWAHVDEFEKVLKAAGLPD